MHIVIASLNQVKIAAVQEALTYFDIFSSALFTPVEVPSQVSEQPLSFQEIVTGARTRAYNSFLLTKNCTLAVGIESGIVSFAEIHQQFNMVICALYTHDTYYIGYSSGIPVPAQCMQLIIEEQLTWSQAAAKVGIITSPDASRSLQMADQDMVFTHGLFSRKEQIKQAIISAAIPYINTTWFAPNSNSLYKQKELV